MHLTSMVSSSDDILETEPKLSPQKTTLVTQQYETIGETLAISEIALFRIGIPFLPPTKKRRELIKKYEGPLDEFIRISLVCVSTKTLDRYCDDLDTIDPRDNSGQELFIQEVTKFERFFACALVFAGLFVASLTVCTILGLNLIGASILSLVTAVPAALLAMYACLEIQRRASFYAILNKELLRRRGEDDPNSSGVLISVKT